MVCIQPPLSTNTLGPNTRVKNFQVGDLVIGDTEALDLTNTGKLMPRWEGPYKVKEVLCPGTYKLT